jgi:hypothetical protein
MLSGISALNSAEESDLSGSSAMLDVPLKHVSGDEILADRHFVHVSSTTDQRLLASFPIADKISGISSSASKQTLARASLALLIAADMGCSRALVPLYELLSSGLGPQTLFDAFSPALNIGDSPSFSHFAVEWKLPVPRSRLTNVLRSIDDETELSVHKVRREPAGKQVQTTPLSVVDEFGDALVPVVAGSSTEQDQVERSEPSLADLYADEEFVTVYRHHSFADTFLRTLKGASNCSLSGVMGENNKVTMGLSAFCWEQHYHSLTATKPTVPTSASKVIRHRLETASDSATDLALGVLYVAAMFGEPEAHAMLMHRLLTASSVLNRITRCDGRYHKGVGVSMNMETAAQYGVLSSEQSSNEFHRVGGQPVMESDRINDLTERTVRYCQRFGLQNLT